jgi:DnaJ-class molecular chaperone
MPRDFYERLGLSKAATDDEIKKAFRKLSKKYHPDLNPGNKAAEAKFKEINEAYTVLSDPKTRADYDLGGQSPFGHGRGPFGGQGGYSGGGGGGAGNFNFEDFGFDGAGGFEDVFRDVFSRGGGRRRQPPQRGGDIEYSLSIDFLHAVKGTEVKLKVSRSGAQETVTTKIPPGVHDGSKVRVAGKGNKGAGGGPAGDLYITMRVTPHAYFKRTGNDISIDLPITVAEAVKGTKVTVPTIDGTTTIKVPPGTQGGSKLRIRKKGAYGPNKAARGDQYVIINIVVPKAASFDSVRLIDEFEKLNPTDPREGLW